MPPCSPLLRLTAPPASALPADFLTATLDKGGLLGMLALNGIFLLVTRHGLEYPRFYQRLYQLLTPDAFHVRRAGGRRGERGEGRRLGTGQQ